MSWSREQKLAFLMRLPWSLLVKGEGSDRSLHVAELPSVIGTGETAGVVERDLWDSLRVTLETYLLYDDPIPLPENVRLPWINADRRAAQREDGPQRVVQGSRVQPVPDTANFSDAPPKAMACC